MLKRAGHAVQTSVLARGPSALLLPQSRGYLRGGSAVRITFINQLIKGHDLKSPSTVVDASQ